VSSVAAGAVLEEMVIVNCWLASAKRPFEAVTVKV
jgi:hypothetical protein